MHEHNNPNNAAEQHTSDAEMFGQTFDEPSTEKPQRSARGRFATGNRGGPGNPFAKQVGWMRSAFFTEATPERLRYIARTFLRMAAEGNVAAGRLVFTYAMGKSPPSPDTQDFTAEDFLPAEEFVPAEDVVPAEAPITQNVTAPAATVPPEGSCAAPSGWSQVEKEVLADLESFGLEEINEYICNNGESLRQGLPQGHRQQTAAPRQKKKKRH